MPNFAVGDKVTTWRYRAQVGDVTGEIVELRQVHNGVQYYAVYFPKPVGPRVIAETDMWPANLDTDTATS